MQFLHPGALESLYISFSLSIGLYYLFLHAKSNQPTELKLRELVRFSDCRYQDRVLSVIQKQIAVASALHWPDSILL